MSDVGLGLSYWLPLTRYALNITLRDEVDAHPGGSRVRRVCDVSFLPEVVEDRSSRQTIRIHAGTLAKLSVNIKLDDRGLIQSIGSQAGRDSAPPARIPGSHAGPTRSVAPTAVRANGHKRSPSLEALWARRYPELASVGTRLEAQLARLLEDLCDLLASSESLGRTATAVEAVQRQLATVSQIKRTWIAAHAREVVSHDWDLAPAELVRVRATSLPGQLIAPVIPPALQSVADEFGVLLVIADRDRGEKHRSTAQTLQDRVALRRCRPAMVGVFLLDDEDVWQLDEASVRTMEVVDEFSDTYHVSLDTSWLMSRHFELSYHRDMSLRSFGLTTAPSAAQAVGGLLEANPSAHRHQHVRTHQARADVRAAHNQLEPLRSSSGYEVLAAERGRDDDALPQQRNIDDDLVSDQAPRSS